mgnify:CR=1 FL=1
MTTFDKVYAAVRLIPRGSVATYGQIAARVPTGNSVTIMIPGQDWCKVTWNGYTGYMLTYFLQQ